jgi:hypothetical protein
MGITDHSQLPGKICALSFAPTPHPPTPPQFCIATAILLDTFFGSADGE